MCQPFPLIRFPAIALEHLEPPGPHFGGRSVDVWSLFFLGHLIRRWARSASCRSTSKATWPRLIGTTGRDMPGSCRQSLCVPKPTRWAFPSTAFILASLVVRVLVQEEVRVTPPEPNAVIGRDRPEGDGVGVLRVQALRPPGGGGHARGGRVWPGGAGEVTVQRSLSALKALVFAVPSQLLASIRR